MPIFVKDFDAGGSWTSPFFPHSHVYIQSKLIKILGMRKHVVFDCDGTILDTSSFKYSLFPEVKDLLLELSTDCLLYVWTARDRQSTQRIFKELGILHFFEAICTFDDALPKPHISGMVSLVGEFPKNSICVIGDTTNDIFGAKNFGVMSIGAIWNKEAKSLILKEAGADFIVSHPSECSKLIRQNLKGDTHV
jgi:phosphoglycolate phosphatase